MEDLANFCIHAKNLNALLKCTIYISDYGHFDNFIDVIIAVY